MRLNFIYFTIFYCFISSAHAAKASDKITLGIGYSGSRLTSISDLHYPFVFYSQTHFREFSEFGNFKWFRGPLVDLQYARIGTHRKPRLFYAGYNFVVADTRFENLVLNGIPNEVQVKLVIQTFTMGAAIPIIEKPFRRSLSLGVNCDFGMVHFRYKQAPQTDIKKADWNEVDAQPFVGPKIYLRTDFIRTGISFTLFYRACPIRAWNPSLDRFNAKLNNVQDVHGLKMNPGMVGASLQCRIFTGFYTGNGCKRKQG